ncbi:MULTISPECIES: class I SAM-dependent methyltransferase [unclassified Nocardioides]|uniref:class I SAM-dependent methyltransferase n=1 Tax=unclassified Nocardioides TaxID=2615069 RepID=UPI000702F39D|nr:MULTISPECIES: class I SAM-dependent methyltransferase [unclassified Nocardioides]KQQ39621.1 methyltransferase type 11 [Nocardioides sp. Leaf307]
MSRPSPGAVPSPNIWHHTATYELENTAVDPERRIEAAMASLHDWAGQRFLDLGCGTGFHLPRWAERAGSVVGVEPHPDLVALARRRTSRLAGVGVLQGTAQDVPLPDASVDVVQARWAYFFGPGCEPGLAELDRVVARGGTAFVVDNDPTRSTFGDWFRRGYPHLDPPAVVERFWSTRGWTRVPLDVCWRFTSRADLEAVTRVELPGPVADAVLGEHEGLEVDYAVNLWWKRF